MRQLKNIHGGHTGLTLMELMVVIAILAIMAGMSMSALSEYIPDYRLQGAARELYAAMHKAKMEAIKRNQDVKVVFDVADSRYAVSVDGDGSGNWSDIDANDNLKIVYLSKYEGAVSYGHGDAKHPVTDDESFPDDNISYYSPDNIATINEQGISNSGYVYLMNNKGNSFVVGSHYGVLVLYRWVDGKWSE